MKQTDLYGDIKSNPNWRLPVGHAHYKYTAYQRNAESHCSRHRTGYQALRKSRIAGVLQHIDVLPYVKSSSANMATCPLTLSIYQKTGDETQTYIAYRRPKMLGEADLVEDLIKLIDGIVARSSGVVTGRFAVSRHCR